jgi:hypothetical protein
MMLSSAGIQVPYNLLKGESKNEKTTNPIYTYVVNY